MFRRTQADLVRGRDYSFVERDGENILSLNTLGKKRLLVRFDFPDCFRDYFDGSWKFGGGKAVSLNGEWYFHISMTKTADREFSPEQYRHVVGIDRGLRFLVTAYDEEGKTTFVDGSEVLKVKPDYTSQRCPKCGRIRKENRHHDTHEYVCDCCGYRSNDDRTGAMNIQLLGTMYLSGDSFLRFGARKTE